MYETDIVKSSSFDRFAFEWHSLRKNRGGKMNISGPVRVEPTRPMTISKRGTDSPRNTANATMADLMRHRWTQKSANNYSNIIGGIVRKMHLPKLPNPASAREFDYRSPNPLCEPCNVSG